MSRRRHQSADFLATTSSVLLPDRLAASVNEWLRSLAIWDLANRKFSCFSWRTAQSLPIIRPAKVVSHAYRLRGGGEPEVPSDRPINKEQLQVNTVLKTSTCRQPSRRMLCVALGLFVTLSFTACSASAQNDLTVRVYTCPTGQAPATADRLRTEFGVFAGVRIAADERTSQVIVQAPAEIQSRVGQRLSAAAPAAAVRQPDNREAPAAAPESRNITLRYATAAADRPSFVEHLGQSACSAMPAATAAGEAIPLGAVGRRYRRDDRSHDLAR